MAIIRVVAVLALNATDNAPIMRMCAAHPMTSTTLMGTVEHHDTEKRIENNQNLADPRIKSEYL